MANISYEIYPGIGIARLGDSQEANNDYFIGPEAPGIVSENLGTYRDSSGNIKRQAARFRIYQFTRDDEGNITKVREITSANATIKWKAHLANRKAAYRFFPPTLENGKWKMRNANIEDRESLVIDSGEQIAPINGDRKALNGKFMGTNVYLGDLLTDDKGRLLVLGGMGISASPIGRDIYDWANNDGWHDDVSDGPISATIEIEGQAPIEAKPAWVVVGVPPFAPGIDNVVTWYDQAIEIATLMDKNWQPPKKPSFTNDIYPIFKRVVSLQWVSPQGQNGHGPHGPADFLQPEMLETLSSNSSDDSVKAVREWVFNSLTKPNIKTEQFDPTGMPKLYSGLDPEDPLSLVHMSLTPIQYDMMKKWSEGDFIADWDGKEPTPTPLETIPANEQPNALNRASLEACVGGSFHPGIECSYPMAIPETYEEPFRVHKNTIPGALTQVMALPWQTDFRNCGEMWWPAQRPEVVTNNGKDFHEWLPKDWSFQDVIDNWGKLNFILKKGEKFLEINPYWTPSQVQAHAQVATAVELYTLPFYLSVMASIVPIWKSDVKSPNNYSPDDAKFIYDTILSVAMEEMLHLELAANLCIALDTTPNFSEPIYGQIPTFPDGTPILDPNDPATHDSGFLNASIGPLDEARLNAMLDIETPDEFESKGTTKPPYNSIAQMYDGLLYGIEEVGIDQFSWSLKNQQIIWGVRSLKGMKYSEQIGSFKSAKQAIKAICEQGEGKAMNPAPKPPFKAEMFPIKEGYRLNNESLDPRCNNSISHFGRFIQIQNLIKDKGYPPVYSGVNDGKYSEKLKGLFAGLLTDMNKSWTGQEANIFEYMLPLLKEAENVWKQGSIPQWS